MDTDNHWDLKQQGVGNKDVNVTHFPFSPVDASLQLTPMQDRLREATYAIHVTCHEGWTQITTGDLKQQGVGNKDVNVTHLPFSPVDDSLQLTPMQDRLREATWELIYAIHVTLVRHRAGREGSMFSSIILPHSCPCSTIIIIIAPRTQPENFY